MAPPAKGDGPERWLAEGFAKLTEDGGVVKRVDEAGEEAEVSSRLEKRGGGGGEQASSRGRAALAMQLTLARARVRTARPPRCARVRSTRTMTKLRPAARW